MQTQIHFTSERVLTIELSIGTKIGDLEWPWTA